MESHISSLTYRARRVNFEFNRSEKYLEQFKTDEYYTKIGNRLDDLLRISFYLVKFFISTPPKYKPRKDLNPSDESLIPYGEHDGGIPPPLEYKDEKFSLYDLDDLPPEIEAEFDFNYFAFYSFLAYLKPSYYFVHDYELVPKGRLESEKERLTRVLANLVQLLSFVRSFDGTKPKDITRVITGLFFRFEKLFSILHDDEAYNNYIFFQEYPSQAAMYTIFVLSYDERSLEEFKDDVSSIFNTYDKIPECEDYYTALQAHKFTLESLLSSSENSDEFKRKLSDHYKLSDFKESLFELSKTLSNKILIEALEIPTIDLNKSFLSVNYGDEVRAREEEIKNVENTLNEAADREKDKLRKNLLSELEEKDRQIQILEQEKRVHEAKIDQLDKQLENSIKNESTSLKEFTSIQSFEKSYPEIYQKISVQSFKLAIHRCDGRINELEDELIKAKNAEKHFKETEEELNRQIEELQQQQTQQHQHQQTEEVVSVSPRWNYQEPIPQPGPLRGSVEEIRSEYGQSYQPQYDDRRAPSVNYYRPSNNPQPRYPLHPGGGYRGGPSRGYRDSY